MATPLKVGLAGLGTVGASVVGLINDQREALALRCGRPIEIVAVTARSRAKNRGIDLRKLRWVKDPIALARDPGIDVFVELIGGAGDPAKSAIEAALASGKSVVTANKALLAKHGVTLAALAERNHVALNFEAAVAGGIPIVKTLAGGSRRQRARAHLRHPERHLQLHPDPHGAGEAVLRRLPEGRPAARLCGGRPDVRHRGPRHRAKAFDPGEPRVRHQGRSRGDLCRGHFVDHAGRPGGRRRARLPGQAARRRGRDRQGHRAARAPDHGAARIPPSPR